MTVVDITRLHRRLFDLPREVFALRCPDCKWHTEVDHLPTAWSLARLHVCRNHRESA